MFYPGSGAKRFRAVAMELNTRSGSDDRYLKRSSVRVQRDGFFAGLCE
jgi:hypothetical protein